MFLYTAGDAEGEAKQAIRELESTLLPELKCWSSTNSCLHVCCIAGVLALLWARVCRAGVPMSSRSLLPLLPDPEGSDCHTPPAAHSQQNLCHRQVLTVSMAEVSWFYKFAWFSLQAPLEKRFTTFPLRGKCDTVHKTILQVREMTTLIVFHNTRLNICITTYIHKMADKAQ